MWGKDDNARSGASSASIPGNATVYQHCLFWSWNYHQLLRWSAAYYYHSFLVLSKNNCTSFASYITPSRSVVQQKDGKASDKWRPDAGSPLESSQSYFKCCSTKLKLFHTNVTKMSSFTFVIYNPVEILFLARN